MGFITKWLQTEILRRVPEVDLAPLTGKRWGKLTLEALLEIINGQDFTESILPNRRLKKIPGC
jgi:hypothetical protein